MSPVARVRSASPMSQSDFNAPDVLSTRSAEPILTTSRRAAPTGADIVPGPVNPATDIRYYNIKTMQSLGLR